MQKHDTSEVPSLPRWFRRIISEGMTGTDVDVVRRKLGFTDSGPYDRSVQERVVGLARRKHVVTEGDVTPEVATVLGESEADKAGLTPEWYQHPIRYMFQEGEDVRALRGRLGLGTRDNRYDPDAEDAVRRFQSAHGLPSTGFVDEELAKRIGSE